MTYSIVRRKLGSRFEHGGREALDVGPSYSDSAEPGFDVFGPTETPPQADPNGDSAAPGSCRISDSQRVIHSSQGPALIYYYTKVRR